MVKNIMIFFVALQSEHLRYFLFKGLATRIAHEFGLMKKSVRVFLPLTTNKKILVKCSVYGHCRNNILERNLRIGWKVFSII